MARLSLPEIQDLGASGAYEGTYTLSGDSAALLLCWLTCLKVWDFSGSGDTLTDPEIEEIIEMIGGLFSEAMNPVGEGTGLITGTIHWAVWEWPYKPEGFLNCNGALYLRAEYPLLCAVLAPVYFQDATYFVTPDLRGRVPIGWGSGPGLSSYSTGDEGGTESELIEDFMLPPHTHEVIDRRNVYGWGGTGLATGTTSGAANIDTGENETLHKRIANIQPYHVIQPYIYTEDRP